MREGDRPIVLLVGRCIIENDNGKILLLRRSKEDSYEPGLWEFPGGKVEKGEDLYHSIENEILEETGLFVKIPKPLFYVESYIVGNNSKYLGLPYLSLIAKGRLVGGNLKVSFEHSNFKWVKINEARSMACTLQTRKAIETFY